MARTACFSPLTNRRRSSKRSGLRTEVIAICFQSVSAACAARAWAAAIRRSQLKPAHTLVTQGFVDEQQSFSDHLANDPPTERWPGRHQPRGCTRVLREDVWTFSSQPSVRVLTDWQALRRQARGTGLPQRSPPTRLSRHPG